MRILPSHSTPRQGTIAISSAGVLVIWLKSHSTPRQGTIAILPLLVHTYTSSHIPHPARGQSVKAACLRHKKLMTSHLLQMEDHQFFLFEKQQQGRDYTSKRILDLNTIEESSSYFSKKGIVGRMRKVRRFSTGEWLKKLSRIFRKTEENIGEYKCKESHKTFFRR